MRMENRKIVLPENVKKIIETLQTHGYLIRRIWTDLHILQR